MLEEKFFNFRKSSCGNNFHNGSDNYCEMVLKTVPRYKKRAEGRAAYRLFEMALYSFAYCCFMDTKAESVEQVFFNVGGRSLKMSLGS